MMDRVNGTSLRSGLLGSVAKYPGAPALVVRDERLCYGELDATARRWAGAILDLLNRRAERIGRQ